MATTTTTKAEETQVEAVTKPCKILVRSKQKLELFPVSQNGSTAIGDGIVLLNHPTTLQCLAKDGSCAFLLVEGVGVVKVDLETPALTEAPEPFLTKSTNIQMMHLSPSGKFLLTWERWYEESCPLNLRLWDAQTGTKLASWAQKNISQSVWPYLQFTPDEKYGIFNAMSQVRIYTLQNLLDANGWEPRYTEQQTQKTASIGVPQYPMQNKPYYFTSFRAKTKDKPAVAEVWEYRPGNGLSKRASKSLFQAEECVVRWSPDGSACLISLQTAVDATGQSYYGSSQLYLWSGGDEITGIDLTKGSVQSAEWLPHPDKPVSFIVITALYPIMVRQQQRRKRAVLHTYSISHRNTITFAPHGRFVCVGGFGNLAGGMGFWDVNKRKLLPHDPTNAAGELRAQATVTMHSWSPDSRLFLVATTAPRMNVDNGICLYKYTGEKLGLFRNEPYQPNKLLQACFVPSHISSYPDRPQSPPPERKGESAAGPAVIAKPTGRYVPPSARNGNRSSFAERMRTNKITSSTPTSGGSPTKKPGVVGVTAPTKTKAQIKRERQKRKAAEKARIAEQEAAEEARKTEEAAKTAESAAAAKAEPPVDPVKRLRKVKKLLKQIDDLKKNETLNDDQLAKLAQEAELREEMAALQKATTS